jgi:hypothetical protein
VLKVKIGTKLSEYCGIYIQIAGSNGEIFLKEIENL